jgi:hypothetical protein
MIRPRRAPGAVPRGLRVMPMRRVKSNPQQEATMAKPAYRAYTVIKRENKDDYWLNLGVAFPHEDGEGFNLLLQALPLDGKIVLRTYKEDEEEEQKPKGKPQYKK